MNASHNNEELDDELARIRAKKIERYQKMANLPTGVIHFDEQSFNKTIMESPIPVFVDFWAEWCGPCKAVAPVIDQLEKEYRGSILFGKLNTDNHQDIAMKYRVMSIPTFIIFKKGTAAIRFVGALPKNKIKEHIEKALK